MRNLFLILVTTFYLIGCGNSEDSSNVNDATAEKTVVKNEQKFSKEDFNRADEILESLRNPKFELNIERASGPNTSLGLGVREGEITSYHDLIVDYEDSEILKYKDLLSNGLKEIYIHAEYRQIHDEIFRLYKLFGIDYAKQAMVKHCLDTGIKSEFRQWAMFKLSKLLFKNADDKTLQSLIPLLTDRDEEIRCDCVSIFKSTKAKWALPELLKRFNDKGESTKVKLFLISAICAIDKKYQKIGAKYANDVYLNTKSKEDHIIHDLALDVASEINDDSTLEMMLEFTKEGCYTEKFLEA